LTGSGDQEWGYEKLWDFKNTRSDGPGGSAGPFAELLIDPKTSVIYGTTYGGGRFGEGSVFQFAPGGQLTTLHDFRGVYGSGKPDGSQPRGQLTFGADGALYGTTESGDKGGHWNQGTIYRLNKADGQWGYSILHEFMGGDLDGSEPKSGLTLDGAGRLIGTTSGGGPNPYEGVVYQFANSGGKWKLTLLHSFKGKNEGAAPWSKPILSKGDLFGTAIMGGIVTRCHFSGCGTVYEIAR